ncbi:hypothetical protein QFC22_005293 [Naganishia vaughanmartiniae]|uniref:Uncharacterized protein n=1 Tax=Naganishia vaughanmartiniae TaxID=1424756 RepID=A0ACC2WWJ4_9TREE|nr:hypothetical protein QFC22_005293 [Naganishia vaughanmartiniae]
MVSQLYSYHTYLKMLTKQKPTGNNMSPFWSLLFLINHMLSPVVAHLYSRTVRGPELKPEPAVCTAEPQAATKPEASSIFHDEPIACLPVASSDQETGPPEAQVGVATPCASTALTEKELEIDSTVAAIVPFSTSKKNESKEHIRSPQRTTPSQAFSQPPASKGKPTRPKYTLQRARNSTQIQQKAAANKESAGMPRPKRKGEKGKDKVKTGKKKGVAVGGSRVVEGRVDDPDSGDEAGEVDDLL